MKNVGIFLIVFGVILCLSTMLMANEESKSIQPREKPIVLNHDALYKKAHEEIWDMADRVGFPTTMTEYEEMEKNLAEDISRDETKSRSCYWITSGQHLVWTSSHTINGDICFETNSSLTIDGTSLIVYGSILLAAHDSSFVLDDSYLSVAAEDQMINIPEWDNTGSPSNVTFENDSSVMMNDTDNLIFGGIGSEFECYDSYIYAEEAYWQGIWTWGDFNVNGCTIEDPVVGIWKIGNGKMGISDNTFIHAGIGIYIQNITSGILWGTVSDCPTFSGNEYINTTGYAEGYNNWNDTSHYVRSITGTMYSNNATKATYAGIWAVECSGQVLLGYLNDSLSRWDIADVGSSGYGVIFANSTPSGGASHIRYMEIYDVVNGIWTNNNSKTSGGDHIDAIHVHHNNINPGGGGDNNFALGITDSDTKWHNNVIGTVTNDMKETGVLIENDAWQYDMTAYYNTITGFHNQLWIWNDTISDGNFYCNNFVGLSGTLVNINLSGFAGEYSTGPQFHFNDSSNTGNNFYVPLATPRQYQISNADFSLVSDATYNWWSNDSASRCTSGASCDRITTVPDKGATTACGWTPPGN